MRCCSHTDTRASLGQSELLRSPGLLSYSLFCIEVVTLILIKLPVHLVPILVDQVRPNAMLACVSVLKLHPEENDRDQIVIVPHDLPYTRLPENVISTQERSTPHCRLPEFRLNPAIIPLRELRPVRRGFGLKPVEIIDMVPLVV